MIGVIYITTLGCDLGDKASEFIEGNIEELMLSTEA